MRSTKRRLERENRRLLYELSVANRQVPHLRTLVEGSSDMLALTSLDGLVLEYNSAFALQLEAVGAPLDQADLFQLFSQEEFGGEALLSPNDLAGIQNETQRFYGYIQPSKEPVEVALDRVVIADEPAFVVSARQLDEAARHRRDLISAQSRVQELNDKLIREREIETALRLDSLSVLAGTLAHDLNNALMVVFANVDLLKELTRDETLLEIANDIYEGTTSARELASRLGTYGKGPTVVLKDMELQPWLPVVIRALSSANRSSIPVSVVEEPAWIKGDESQLTQVFTNLVTNAFQAGGSESSVEVRLYAASKAATSEEVPPGSSSDNGNWCIDVLDRGPGLDPKTAEKIFDPFFSTKTAGSGLGLTSCSTIIRAHSGTLEAHARDGGGCCMRVTLPAHAPPTHAAHVASPTGSDVSSSTQPARTGVSHRPSEAEGAVPLEDVVVIVMDDEPYVRETLARLLSGFGATVHSRSKGEEVTELYSKLHSSGVQPLLLLDLNIARGLDGIPTLERLLQIDPDVRAIACSGYSEVDIAQDHRVLGFKGYLAKPFRSTEIVETLLAIRT